MSTKNFNRQLYEKLNDLITVIPRYSDLKVLAFLLSHSVSHNKIHTGGNTRERYNEFHNLNTSANNWGITITRLRKLAVLQRVPKRTFETKEVITNPDGSMQYYRSQYVPNPKYIEVSV